MSDVVSDRLLELRRQKSPHHLIAHGLGPPGADRRDPRVQLSSVPTFAPVFASRPR
jgi:hypothetical protein